MQTRLGLGVVVIAVGLSVVLVGVLGGIGTVGGVEDSGPLAEAGLDQTTTEGSTVYLDAGGSTATDGRITSYEWSIDTPSGKTIEPECTTCVTTSFVANESGTYEVSVEVTDEEGRSDSDMLYVEVEPYDPPAVSVTGPSEVSAGQSPTYTATATATEEPLSSLLWRQDGRYHADTHFSNAWSVTEETTITFTEPGVYEVNATFADELGYQTTDGMAVRVTTANPYLAISITDIDSPVRAGESLTVTATVENVGDGVGSQTVSLTRGGSLVGSTTVSLAPEAEQTLEFTWNTTDEDIGGHEFVARTDNDTDRREGTVQVGIPDDFCSGLGGSDCLFKFGELGTEVAELEDGTMLIEAVLQPPEGIDAEPIELDPSEHDFTFVTADGRELEVGPDGEIPLDRLGKEGKVGVEFGKNVGKLGHWFGATLGEYKEDTTSTPDRKSNFDDFKQNVENPDKIRNLGDSEFRDVESNDPEKNDRNIGSNARSESSNHLEKTKNDLPTGGSGFNGNPSPY